MSPACAPNGEARLATRRIRCRGGLAALALAGVAAAFVAWSGSPRASTLNVYGFDAPSMAVGGAVAASATDHAALFYNPAGLVVSKRAHLSLGMTLAVPTLGIDRQGGDPEAHPSVLPEAHYGVSLGWVHALGGVLEHRLALGVALYLPIANVARVQGIDRQAPQFYRYQNLADKLVFLAGIAGEPVDGLSLGIGAQILVDVAGGAHLEMDVLAGAFEHREFSVELGPTAAPIAGVRVAPWSGLSIGLSWRGSASLNVDLPIHVEEGEAFTLDLGVAQTVLWTPHEITLGMAYAFEAPLALTVGLDLTYERWSDAPDPSPQLSVDLGGKLLEGLGLGSALDLSARTAPVQLGFVDTVTVRLGADWDALDWLAVRAGYVFRPTPAPKPTATTAYLDSDAHLVSAGLAVTFQDPLDVHPTPTTIDVAGQVTVLSRRTVVRQGGADPIGDLSYGGPVWTFAARVSHSY